MLRYYKFITPKKCRKIKLQTGILCKIYKNISNNTFNNLDHDPIDPLALVYLERAFFPLMLFVINSFKNRFLFRINLALGQILSLLLPNNLKLLRLREVSQF